jgi:hypothetical protein
MVGKIGLFERIEERPKDSSFGLDKRCFCENKYIETIGYDLLLTSIEM